MLECVNADVCKHAHIEGECAGVCELSQMVLLKIDIHYVKQINIWNFLPFHFLFFWVICCILPWRHHVL